MTCDTWHVTCDMWHVTCDMWYVTGGGRWTFFQNFSSLALTDWEWRFVEDLEEKERWLNESINQSETKLFVASARRGLLYVFIYSWRWPFCRSRRVITFSLIFHNNVGSTFSANINMHWNEYILKSSSWRSYMRHFHKLMNLVVLAKQILELP